MFQKKGCRPGRAARWPSESPARSCDQYDCETHDYKFFSRASFAPISSCKVCRSLSRNSFHTHSNISNWPLRSNSVCYFQVIACEAWPGRPGEHHLAPKILDSWKKICFGVKNIVEQLCVFRYAPYVHLTFPFFNAAA